MQTTPSAASLSPRQQLIETALALFSRRGFQGVGIDRLLTEAGVAKMTLYKHFHSKDELILAVLRERDERWRRWFERSVLARTDEPRGRLLAIFDALAEWFAEDDFNGCLFINVMAEFGGTGEPVRALADQHRELVESTLRSLAKDAGACDPDALARALLLLIEGAIVVAHVSREPQPAAHAKRAAAILLAAQLPESPASNRRGGLSQESSAE